MMNVLITGAKGQLGYELQRTAPEGATLHCVDLPELNIADAAALERCVSEIKPTLILNAAAYTAVDKAESDREAAYAVNRDAAGKLAKLALAQGARLLHVSTDFAFDGRMGRTYRPGDTVSPLSVYGDSKAQGDALVLANHPENSLVVRTAWVYSAHGGNFVKSIIKLLREREKLTIIADQIGTPTWAKGLAQALWAFAQGKETGLWHYTDAGVCSWYDYAVAIGEEALALGLISAMKPILPIRTVDYPTPATRPSFSVLDKTATWASLAPSMGAPVHWRQNLRAMLAELKSTGF